MFHSPVFQKISWHEAHNQFERLALQDVAQLDEKILFDPQLAGVLEKIVKKHTLDVAKLDTQAGTAKAAKSQTRNAAVDALEVPISFTGDATSFHISPSHTHIIQVPAVDVQKDRVVVTVYEHAIQQGTSETSSNAQMKTSTDSEKR